MGKLVPVQQRHQVSSIQAKPLPNLTVGQLAHKRTLAGPRQAADKNMSLVFQAGRHFSQALPGIEDVSRSC
jgi:hypothetical protein